MSFQDKHVVVVGGTRGLGLEIARSAWERGAVVTLTGRDRAVSEAVAKGIDADRVMGRACDLTDWPTIGALFDGMAPIDHLIITALDRDFNTIANFDPEQSAKTLLMKNVGYAEVVHRALPHFASDASVVLFSGLSMWRPIPGSTTISMANAGVIGLTRSLAVQIAPVRVNAITPGVISGTAAVDEADVARRAMFESIRERTPGKRLPTPGDIVAATFALTDNPGINGENLTVDAGIRLV